LTSQRRVREKFREADTYRIPPLLPKTDKQAGYIKAIGKNEVVVSTGYAGTGKTYIAATMAADMYREGRVHEIVLTRPNVSAGAKLGYFPGTLEEKMDPWMVPLTSRISSRLGRGAYETGVRNGNIKVVPFETMRGLSLNGFVILDEAQNTTPHEMKMFLTRFESGKIVINGDVRQSDLKTKSGLSVLVDLIKRGKLPFSHVDFSNPDDIVRSDIVRQVILAFEGIE